MHDPLVQAWRIPSPRLQRDRWRDAKAGEWRWGWCRERRTNEANLGEPVYHWWRLAGWRFRFAGRAYSLAELAIVWHQEPQGRDSGTVCKHHYSERDEQLPSRLRVRLTPWLHESPYTRDGIEFRYVINNAWKYHFWHWHLSIRPYQRLRVALMYRCGLCGRRFRRRDGRYSNSWDPPKVRLWRVDRHCLHRECSDLVARGRTIEQDEALIRALFAAQRVALDLSEAELLDRLTDARSTALAFHEGYRLQRLLGFERDDDYNLVKSERA